MTISCKELVELVTEFFEGTMPREERLRFEEHIAVCPPCRTHLEQMRETIHLLGMLPAESISPDAEQQLLRAFRDWKEQ